MDEQSNPTRPIKQARWKASRKKRKERKTNNELAGSKLKMKTKDFDNTELGEYDAKAGTITFSPGIKRVVFVRAK